MTNHKNRLAKLEQQTAPVSMPRVIVQWDNKYHEGGIEMSEADYQAIAQDPASDVTLICVVYASEAQPVSTITNGDYSVTVGLDMEEI